MKHTTVLKGITVHVMAHLRSFVSVYYYCAITILLYRSSPANNLTHNWGRFKRSLRANNLVVLCTFVPVIDAQWQLSNNIKYNGLCWLLQLVYSLREIFFILFGNFFIGARAIIFLAWYIIYIRYVYC